MYTPHTPSAGHIERLRQIVPGMQVTVARSEADALAVADRVEVILGHRYLRQCLPHAERLRWVQSTSGGADRMPCEALRARGVTLCRFTGSRTTIARHALTLAWAITRGLPTMWRNQRQRTWSKDLPLLPAPTRAIVFGTGHIGREIARLLQRDGVHVTGVKRRKTHTPMPGFDALQYGSAWRSVLPEVDWCFLALPNTASTRHMIDEAALRALPRHAILVNVGRGETLDTEALMHVLRDGHLGGAALDVLPEPLEPLDATHGLWDVPRLLITPHVGAYDPNRRDLVEAFCEAQMRRYVAGEPLKDVVISAE